MTKSTSTFFYIVDKNGNPIGLDAPSGGHPHVAYMLSDIKFWGDTIEAKADMFKYFSVINYGDKGYEIHNITVSLS